MDRNTFRYCIYKFTEKIGEKNLREMKNVKLRRND